jgi:hypothetical protein
MRKTSLRTGRILLAVAGAAISLWLLSAWASGSFATASRVKEIAKLAGPDNTFHYTFSAPSPYDRGHENDPYRILLHEAKPVSGDDADKKIDLDPKQAEVVREQVSIDHLPWMVKVKINNPWYAPFLLRNKLNGYMQIVEFVNPCTAVRDDYERSICYANEIEALKNRSSYLDKNSGLAQANLNRLAALVNTFRYNREVADETLSLIDEMVNQDGQEFHDEGHKAAKFMWHISHEMDREVVGPLMDQEYTRLRDGLSDQFVKTIQSGHYPIFDCDDNSMLRERVTKLLAVKWNYYYGGSGGDNPEVILWRETYAALTVRPLNCLVAADAERQINHVRYVLKNEAEAKALTENMAQVTCEARQWRSDTHISLCQTWLRNAGLNESQVRLRLQPLVVRSLVGFYDFDQPGNLAKADQALRNYGVGDEQIRSLLVPKAEKTIATRIATPEAMAEAYRWLGDALNRQDYKDKAALQESRNRFGKS